MSSSVTPRTEPFSGAADGITDNAAAFAAAIAVLEARGGGTISLADGTYALSRTLPIPPGVSLQMTPAARLLALPDFAGDALVQVGRDGGPGPQNQSLIGGTLDANRLPLVGLRIARGLGITVENVVIQDALKTGVEMGVERSHEIVLSKVRIVVDRATQALPDSKGIHMILAHDCVARDVVVTGYANGVWTSASSDFFHMVHVWNWHTQVPLRICFYDEGNNNSYMQCYADGPTVAAGETGYGWYLKGPHTRIVASQLYASHWTPRDTMVGIYVAPGAIAPTFMANHFMVCAPDNPQGGNQRHDMQAAFAGALDGACILGNTYDKWIATGKRFGLPEMDNEARTGGSPED